MRGPCRLVAALLVGAALLTLGCARLRRDRGSDPDTALLSNDELYARGMQALEQRELRRARTFLERIDLSGADRATLEPKVRLALADATFYAGDDISLIEARSKYLDFVTLYSDHPEAPYAQLQAGVCSLRQVGDAARDQSQTEVAIGDLREVERRWPDSKYVPAARDMLARAQDNLAEHEFLVGRFYFNRKAYLAATDRFRTVLQRYPTYRGRPEVLLLLGQALVLNNNPSEGRLYLEQVVREFPGTDPAEQAQEFLAEQVRPAEDQPQADAEQPRG